MKGIVLAGGPAHGFIRLLCKGQRLQISKELGWLPTTGFDEVIKRAIKWYPDNRTWWEGLIK